MIFILQPIKHAQPRTLRKVSCKTNIFGCFFAQLSERARLRLILSSPLRAMFDISR